jgi:hypothetical protein
MFGDIVGLVDDGLLRSPLRLDDRSAGRRPERG